MRETSPTRVLVIDDEPVIRESLVEFLEDFGLEAASAGSGEEALSVLTENPCDVAIVDQRLPGISSDNLILRIHEILPAIRFLIHTGAVDYQLSTELRQIGLRDEHIFLKPQLDLTSFVEAIRNDSEIDRVEYVQ
ncbi:MAG: response regulator [Deltaproteobacteria bacterium]|nr:response regulator [Deltaproteobacteria bacterium]